MKMIHLKYYIALIIIMSTAASCRKVIDLKLGNHTGELVIEGNITNVFGTQSVKLSRNVPFTNTNVYPPVSGATVTIDDTQGNHYILKENIPGTYSIDDVAGIAGQTYMLTVVVEGKTYTAQSTMPSSVRLDSITSKGSLFDNTGLKRTITVYFQDAPNVPNQYRFVMFVNQVQVNDIFAFDDEFIDGKYVNLDLQETDQDIFPKDTVTVEMQCIDKPVYTYWYSLMQQSANNPGGAVAPANPPTNIMPATLGYFSAHTTQTIILEVN